MGNKENNENKYQKLIEEINIIFHDKDNYTYCLQKTKEFLHLIKDEKADDTKFRFAYVTLSKVYNNMGDKKRALSNIIKARTYLKNSDISKKILVDWQTGMCYKDINNKKALQYFQKCYDKSSEIEDYEYMGGVLDEIAQITKNIDTMLYSIDIYKNCKTLPFINKQNDLDKMYSHLFQLYIHYNNEIEAFKTLHNINNKSLIKELKETLNVFKSA